VNKSAANPVLQQKTVKFSEKSSKRGKKSSTEKVATTGIKHVLKEKQLRFLHNLNNIIEKNCQTKVLGSFTLTEQLATIGFKKMNVLGDGNCFFRAISHQLYQDENRHLNIRSEAINYLILYMNDFVPFIDTSKYPTIEMYIERMSQDGAYVDHLAISATAFIINKNIIVHEIGKIPLLIPGSISFDDQLHVCYDPTTEHYDSVICIDGNSPILSSQQILFS